MPASVKSKRLWPRLVRAEPALARLLSDIRKIKAEPGVPFCANNHWYGYYERPSLRARLSELVGWERLDKTGNPLLGSSEAYSAAYNVCYQALPDCCDCNDM